VQCVTAWCSVLQRGAVCYSVVQCVTAWCSVLQRGAVCYSVLQCVANMLNTSALVEFRKSQIHITHNAYTADLAIDF